MANKRLKRLNKFLAKREQVRRGLSNAATDAGMNMSAIYTRRQIREMAHRIAQRT